MNQVDGYWQSARRGRLARRTALRLTALGAVGLAVACSSTNNNSSAKSAATAANKTTGANPTVPVAPAGAGNGAGSPAAFASPAAQASETPKSGGTFLITTGDPVGGQDPNFGPVNGGILQYSGDPYLKIDNISRKISPGVVEKWEQTDPLTLVLHVRQGVKFFNLAPANGRAVEAKDIVYAMKSESGQQYPDAKFPFPRQGALAGMKDVTPVDPATVNVTFTTPNADFVLGMSEARNCVLPEGLRETFGAPDSLQGLLAERIVYTGPYIPTKLTPGVEFIWDRNPAYWDKPIPYMDRIQQTTVPDPSTWATDMISGQNYFLNRVELQTVDLVKKGLPNVNVVKYAPNSSWYHLGFNTKNKPLDDPRVRRALSLVFDKPQFGRAILGADDLWKYPGPLPWSYPEAIPQEQLAPMPLMRSPTPADITEAKQLLSAAGYDQGFTIKITTAADQKGIVAFQQVSEHLQNQAQKYLPGVKIDIDATTYTQMLTVIAKGDHQAYTGGWFHELSPVNMMAISYLNTGPRNFTGINDQQMNDLINNATQEFDTAKRQQMITQMQQRAFELMSHLPTHHNVMLGLTHPKVHGLEFGSLFEPTHYQRYAWIA